MVKKKFTGKQTNKLFERTTDYILRDLIKIRVTKENDSRDKYSSRIQVFNHQSDPT